MLPIAADYPFLEIVGTILVFFAWVAWFWVLISVLGDVFRRHDLNGWGKAGWTLLVIIVPFLGVLLYLAVEGRHMAERSAKALQAQRAQVDAHIREVAGGPAAEIARAKELLDSGAIDQAEFDRLKAKSLT